MPAEVAKVFAPTEIIFEIHRLQFGTAFSGTPLKAKKAFIQSVTTYSKNHKGVAAGTIRNWLGLGSTLRAPNDGGKRFLLRYLKHIVSEGLIVAGMEIDAASLEQFLRETVPDRRSGEQKQAEDQDDADGGLDRIVIDRLGNLFRASRGNRRSITSDLFHNGDPQDETDWSYFLVYRYSTNRGELLKSFLVIQKPDPAFKDYGFNHFVWGGQKKGQNWHVFRECEGAVLALEKAYYFLGYNFVVGANKRESTHSLYEKARRSAKEHPNGMGLLSAEYEEITRDKGLFSGVTMTIAAGHQPVVARLAFLHLGTRTSLGCELSDRHVNLRELSASELASDLRSTVGRLRRECHCENFGIHLQRATSEKSWVTKGAPALAARILQMIDNTPAWEATQATAPRSGGSKAKKRPRPKRIEARGALETHGPGRPRE